MCRARFAAPPRSRVPSRRRRGAQRSHGRDEHDRARGDRPDPADDVEELLHAHVRAETGLGDDVVAELQADEVGDERRVPVGDVRERPAVDERRLALERLDEVRLDRVLEENGHCPGRLQLLGRDRLALPGVGDRDRTEPLAQVEEVAGDGGDRHHLGGGGDVEAGLADVAVRASAEADDDAAERAVVHVHAAAPTDGQRVDPERVPVQDVRLEHRGEQVVGGADRVDVSGEVEVQVLHRHDLRVAAAGRAALDPEHRAERRLAQAEHRALADLAEPLRQADRGRRLALARLRRRDRGDADELAVRAAGEALEDGEVDLRLVAAVELDLVVVEAHVLGDLGDRPQVAAWAISRLDGILVVAMRGRPYLGEDWPG